MSGRAGENTQSTWVGPWPEAARNVRSVLAGNVKASPGPRVTGSPARVISSSPASTKTNSTSVGSA